MEATPTPEPTATPEPDKDLYVDVTVVQQDIGVELYTLPTTTPESASNKDEDAEEKLPLLDVAATVTLTDKDGKTTDYELDTKTGTALAEEVERRLAPLKTRLTVAVMGCVVNGPGEAREADIGIAGGRGEGVIIRKGEILCKVPEDQLLPRLLAEIEEMTGETL